MIKPVSLDTVYKIRHIAMYPNDTLEIVKVKGDESAQHLGYFLEDTCVSVLSIFKNNEMTQVRKFATLPHYQNKGYGSKLLSTCLNNIPKPIILNARYEKIPFYEKFGFKKNDITFSKNGFDYVIMRLD